jgi:hypothetical protein
MIKDFICSSPLSFDGAASSSATVHHMSPRNEYDRRPLSARKKTSPASSNSSEDRRRTTAKNKNKCCPHEFSETGKIRPASAEGFFKGQRAPVRMNISNSLSSCPSTPGKGMDSCLDEVLHLSCILTLSRVCFS